ncbi:hypothetical protein [Lunatimonas salinarum]|uniref:hypothetical protein n=1 Tax=Lunatimonas salinarum TaxID=1774590 RepID=UPI001ADF1847|nr:hypothetical protein [Lunatimonas salinarum]
MLDFKSNWYRILYTPSQDFVNLWHFQYAYDEFGRQTGTKAPGAGWVYTIYDKWDRPVLTQDGEQRAKATPEWSYVKYDIHNRPVITGTIANGTALATLRTQVAASTASRFETRNNSALGYTIGSSYPTTAVDAGILSITYYDDYTFMNHNSWASGTGNSNGLYAFAAESGYFTLQQQNMAVKGLATGSKSRRQGNSTEWINSVTYYDTYYQPI